MYNEAKAATREHLNKLFPERQIIHRASGQINSFVIGQKSQIFATVTALFIAIWCVLTLGNLLWGHNPLRSPSKEVKRVEAEYERRLANSRANEANALALLESQRQEFQQARQDFEDRHGVIRDIMSSRSTGASFDDTAPITSVKYASSNVMMAPVVRDSLPRRSRSDIIESQQAEITGLSGVSLTNLAKDQNDILIGTEANAQSSIEYSRAIVRETGLSVNTLLKEGPNGSGGPEIAIQTSSSVDSGSFIPRTDSIRARVEQADAMSRAMQSVPLGHPVDDEFYRTSAFGPRKDPFTKRTAFHGGVDLAGRRNSAIVATADGTVSFVGTRSGYGRVIEIDHEHGIKTRYAHLANYSVKRGQIIAKGEKIGGMGSSGRSTSTHLHYEVIFQGRTKDPEKFIKAGRYVQQN